MLGAIAGDVIGSVYESAGMKITCFDLFKEQSSPSDDSVLTCAVADVLLTRGDYVTAYHQWFARYPHAGYGGTFYQWAKRRDTEPYGSWGNGSAMRVSPIGWAFNDLEAVLAEAERSAAVTHDHPEGIKGAQAIAAAVWLARQGESVETIRGRLMDRFGYRLRRRVDRIRERYGWDVSCQGSVPEAIICALEATTFEDAVRMAISLGGDADTLACMAGAIAEARFGPVPAAIASEVRARLPTPMLTILDAFREQFQVP